MTSRRSLCRVVMPPLLVLGALVAPLAVRAPAAAVSRLCGPPGDTVAPLVTSVDFSTDPVDVTDGPASVTVTADATDTSATGAPSGVKHLILDFESAHGFRRAHLHLLSGDSTDGEWQGTLKIPDTFRPGTLVLGYIIIGDADRNYLDYTGGADAAASSPMDIRLHPTWPTSIPVVNNNPKPPRLKAGKLSTFSFSPHSVDTRHGPQVVNASATFTGPQPYGVRVLFIGSRYGNHQWGQAFRLRPTASGRLTGHFTVPRWAGTTHAKVRQLFVDYPQNVHPSYLNIQTHRLAAGGFPYRLPIQSRLDATAPALSGLTLHPGSVDTTTAAKQVTVTATVHDHQSGVKHVDVRFEKRGSARGGYREVRLRRHGKVWQGSVRFPMCSASGSWAIYTAQSDRAHNSGFNHPDDLAALGLPSHLTVTSGPQSDAKAPSVANATAAGADHTITLTFTEGATDVSASTLSVYAMEPAADRYVTPLSITGVVCGNGVSTVDCSGSGGLVKSAKLTVPDVTGGQEYEVWANLDAVVPQLTDGTGNPMAWGSAAATVTGA